jgi:hypothetical protein
MAEMELERRLKYIHLTLELIAFLLAAVAFGQGSVGRVVGAGAMVLLLVNAVTRTSE